MKPMKSKAAVFLGRRGGESGTGAAKRRPPEHYRRIARLSAKARKLKLKEKTK